MKQLIAALLVTTALILIPDGARAQCNGQFGANQVCGSVAGGFAGPVNFSAFGAAGNVTWINVKTNCGATGNGSTDDTAAINTCIGNFNSATNGRLYFPAGTYKTTTALTAITANGIILGDGPSNLSEQLAGAVVPATQINNTTTNASVFTINSQQVMVRDLSIKNTAGSTPTAGSAGITVASATEYNNRVNMENLEIQGFNIDVDRQAGANWSMHNVNIVDPVLYGLKIRNTVNPDAGDWSITNSSFYTGVNTNPTDAIRIESSGGGKIANIKVNCNSGCSQLYVNGIDIQGAGNTSDMQITNSSFENFSGVGIIINGNWPYMTINNIQFHGGGLGNPTCITVTNNNQVSISNVASAGVGNCVVLSGVNDGAFSSITTTGGSVPPVSGHSASSGGAVSLYNGGIGTIQGGNKQNLLQGMFTIENNSATLSSLQNITLGGAFVNGGSPTAEAYFGLIGPANDLFTGSAQKDWVEDINGGGNWWVSFNSGTLHGGTNTQGLKVTPLAAGGASLLQVLSGSSGATSGGWLQWGGQQRVTADVAFTSTTTPAVVTGLSETVVAGRNYSFDAYLSWTDAAAGGIQCTINGTATATAIRYDGWIVDSAANGIKGNAAATALGGVVASATTTGTNGVVQIKGTMTVNAGGTMEVRCAQNTSNGTATTIKQGSYWIVQDMP